MSLMSMGITAVEVNKALDRVKRKRFGTSATPSRNTYILCPVDQTLWDLLPVVSIILEGVDQSDKPGEYVTHTFEKNLVKLGFSVIKFASQRNRKLGIRGFDNTKSYDDHTLFREPDGAKIRNGLCMGKAAKDAVEPEVAEAAEGTQVMRQHRKRERNTKIVNNKKKQFLKKHGRLFCDVCAFDYVAKYGDRGAGYIECHHTVPVSEMKPGDKTKLSDLALVCANCHRMIHAKRPWLSIEDMARLLRNPK